MSFSPVRAIAFFLLTAGAVFSDQITKIWAENHLDSTPTSFGFNLAHNRGIAFSVALPFWGIYVLSAVVILGLLAMSFKEKWWSRWQMGLGLCLVFAGALGNLIDRIRLGYVVDFIQVSVWPTFNLADAFIFVGIVLLALFQGRGSVDHGSQ